MPVAAYPLPEWTPDRAVTSDQLSVAQNVRAIANGYAPVPAFSAMTPTLATGFTGGGAFVQSDGTAHLLASREDYLLRYSSGVWGGIQGGLATTRRWYFAQFGDRVIFANGGALSAYEMSSQSSGSIAGAPSNAIDVCRIKDHVVAPTDDHQVIWSEFNNSAEWDEGENQSDRQPLLDGGPAVRIIGGEYGLLLQENAIQRLSYVGGDTVFQFDVISPEIGCMADGSVAFSGRLVFFLSERGFQMCNGVEVTPIGDEKFNRWFFSHYSREDIANIWAAIDPRNSHVYWAMPGTPGRLLCYNWVLQRATIISCDVMGLFSGTTPNISIDALDAIYGDLDSIDVSLDDPLFQGGNPLLLLVDGGYVVGTLGGANLEATIEIPAVEPTPLKRSRIRSVRLTGDVTEANITIDARMRRGDAEANREAGSMRLNGKCNIRANGRYNDIRITIPAGAAWSDVQGCEIEFEAGDGR